MKMILIFGNTLLKILIIFNALIVACNAPYNALYYLMNTFNHSYNTVIRILIYVLCIVH